MNLSSGLQAHYNFNTNTADVSGNNNDGILLGPELTDDRFGNCDYAYHFLESPDVISLPNTIMHGLTAFSVSIWLKTDRPAVAFSAANVNRDNEFFIQILSSGNIGTTSRANPNLTGQRVDGSVIVTDNEWHHIVVTRNATDGTMTIFVDGVLDIRTNRVFAGNLLPLGPLVVDPNGLYIGNDQDCVSGCWDANQQWTGELDDVRIFNREITFDEVVALQSIDESITYPVLDLGFDVRTCDLVTTLDAGLGFDSYLWSNGATTQTIEVMSSGDYSVTTSFLACSFVDEINVNFEELGTLNLSYNETELGCNDEIIIDATDGFDSYVWSNGVIGRSINVSTPGVYSVRVTDFCGEITSEEVVITLDELSEVNLTYDRTELDCNDEILIEASDGFDSYVWSNGAIGRSIRVHSSGAYFVRAMNVCGETISDEVVITSIYDRLAQIPNAFSPNGNGINDFFELPEALQGYNFKVFSRWGHKIFESRSYQNAWAADDLPVGTYYYAIDGPCLDGPIRGWLQLVK